MKFDVGMEKYQEIENVLVSNSNPSQKMIEIQDLFPSKDKDEAEIDRLFFLLIMKF